ncbi:MAG TPA: protease pro-enzyme activation domain-containing protein [Verrucomicrobiae bacterium]|nr:protease pro-enzyme activation domain-containing protein [Verrucomicrobiae bacterium]
MKIALCALLAMAIPGMAVAQQMKTLGGHVPSVVSRFHLQPTGELPADTNLTLAISLPIANEAEVNSLLSQIYDPASTNYHHFLPAGEFARRFGPSAADYQKVMNFAKTHNLAVVGSYSNQMLLDVRGKASDIENAFHVTLHTYRHPLEKRIFFAPDSDPVVDPSVPISHVSGLNNYFIPHPMLTATPLSGVPAGAKHALGSGPIGLYMGNDFRAAYAPGVSLDGTGQKVGLFELDGYFTADILSYEAAAGLPNLTITNIPVDGGVSVPSFGGGLEVSLDIEMVISMATNTSEVVVYEAPNSFATPVDVLNRIASDDLAKQISSSWLIGDDPSYDVYYKQMALQGQSFFQASGDNGAFYTTDEQVQEWADDTNITLVGGTTLSTTGPVGNWTSETVWNQFSESGGGQDGSGGGTNWNGILIPPYQQPVPMTNNQGSTTLRNVPDVALTADNIYVIADDGFQFAVVGTSAAAPLWAGFTALVNQQAVGHGLSTVGFLNPAIYAIGLNPLSYTNCFHDIITGNNTNLIVGDTYSAVPGYDLATGWGTPSGSNLINALTATAPIKIFTHLSPPAPPYGSTLSTLNGGNPNGNWELFGLDDQVLNSGGITNGWILTLTTANPIGNVADVGVTMIASAAAVLTNQQVKFFISVNNYGPNTASNVVIHDDLPSGFTLITNSVTLGSVTNVGTTFTWNVATSLVYTAGAQLTLTMQAPGAVEQAENSAYVTSDTPDQNPADASAYSIINVTTPPSVPPLLSSLGIGAGGTFHLTISNNSPLPVVIQASTNLVNWVNVATNNSGAPFIYTDTVTLGFPTRFYRALTQ